MTPVVVAIPTFHRPDRLASLLEVLVAQADGLARIVVIDNDPEGSAAATATRFGATYALEPARGLAAVRNRALDISSDARALVFIDDDEIPGDEWLASLIDRWRTSGAQAVSGRVETVFPDGFDDPWILRGGFFRRVAFADGARQPAAATNNVLLDLAFIRANGLRFDEAFGLSGGEDILFTSQLVARGGTIVSCPDAVVFDVVDPARLTRAWVLQRAYRVGLTTIAVRLRMGGGIGVRLRAWSGGAARVVAGILRWGGGTIVRSPRHSARGARAAWRGAGMFLGASGRRYDEYARRR